MVVLFGRYLVGEYTISTADTQFPRHVSTEKIIIARIYQTTQLCKLSFMAYNLTHLMQLSRFQGESERYAAVDVTLATVVREDV